MEGQIAYQAFTALKLHFTSKYDYFQYNGKTRAIDLDKLALRKDYFHYRKVERRYRDELVNFIVANLVSGKASWIGDLITLEAEKIYRDWKKRQEAIKYFIRLDLEKIDDDSKTLWTVIDGHHPTFLKLYLGKKISIETLIAADCLLNFRDYWDRSIAEKIIWPDVSRLMMKYRPFLAFDRSEIKKIMKDTLMT